MLLNKTQETALFGIGLRPVHYQDIVTSKPLVDWFEIISEDYFVDGGEHLNYLDRIRQDYTIAMHGVSMSIGSSDPLNWEYLKKLKQLVERIDPMWVSDHLCWTGVNQINTHDLLPMPFLQEAVEYVAQRVQQVQDFLGHQILLENVSSYVSFKESEMTEWEFLSAVAERADCLILLDINNIFVNAFNHQFNPDDYLHGVPANRIKQFHLAGHKNCQTHIIDTHDDDIIDQVWQLYAKALHTFGPVATLIERDSNFPPLKELIEEINQARAVYNKIVFEKSAVPMDPSARVTRSG